MPCEVGTRVYWKSATESLEHGRGWKVEADDGHNWDIVTAWKPAEPAGWAKVGLRPLDEVSKDS